MLLKRCGIPWLSMVLIYISVYRTNRIILCLMCSPNSHGHPAWTPAITPQGPTENIRTVRQPQGSPIPGLGLFDSLWMGGEKRMEERMRLGSKERKRESVLMYTQKLFSLPSGCHQKGSHTQHTYGTLWGIWLDASWGHTVQAARWGLDSTDWHAVRFIIWHSESNLNLESFRILRKWWIRSNQFFWANCLRKTIQSVTCFCVFEQINCINESIIKTVTCLHLLV